MRKRQRATRSARSAPTVRGKVKTVRRKPNADRVGAIVVPATYVPPAKIESLADVPHVSITIRNLKGAGDYGKL